MPKFYAIFLFFVCFNSSAQKVDLDALPIDVSYVSYPQRPFSAEYTTYSVEYDIPASVATQLGVSAPQLKSNCCQISGYKDVNKGGHFVVRISLETPTYGNVREMTSTYKVKDQSGKEVQKTNYYILFNYAFQASIVIMDYKQAIIGKYTNISTVTNEGKTQEFSTSAQMKEYWSKNSMTVIVPLWRKLLSNNIAQAGYILNSNHGYHNVSKEKAKLWILDSKKHPEFEAFQQHYETIKTAFGGMTASTPLNKSALNSAITYFESLPNKYSADEKSDRKIRYAAYFNLGVIYYWLEDFENAAKNADLLVKNDYDKSDGTSLLSSIGRVKASLAANNAPNRHKIRDIANATPPALSEWGGTQAATVPSAALDEDDLRYGENNAQLGGAPSQKAAEDKKAQAAYEIQNVMDQIGDLLENIQKRNANLKVQIKALDEEIAKDSTNAKLYYTRAVKLRSLAPYEKGHWDATVKDFQKASALKPKDEDYLFDYASILGTVGKHEEAIKEYDKLTTLKPKHVKAYQNKANLLQYLGRYPQSIEASNRALELDSKNFDAMMLRGFTYYYMDKYEEAMRDFDAAIPLNLKSGYAHAAKGYIKNAQGKFEEAIPYFDKSAQVEPKQARPYANKAFSLGNLNKMDEAKRQIAEAIKLGPTYGNAYYIRAWLNLKEKNYEAVYADVKKCLDYRFPEKYKPWTVLGEAYMEIGEYDKAKEMFEQALAMKKNYAPALQGQANLLKLKK